MKHQKTLNLFNDTNNSKFVTRTSNIINYNKKTNYGVVNEITCNAKVLESDLCDCNMLTF